jgi:hypothetical protein
MQDMSKEFSKDIEIKKNSYWAWWLKWLGAMIQTCILATQEAIIRAKVIETLSEPMTVMCTYHPSYIGKHE